MSKSSKKNKIKQRSGIKLGISKRAKQYISNGRTFRKRKFNLRKNSIKYRMKGGAPITQQQYDDIQDIFHNYEQLNPPPPLPHHSSDTYTAALNPFTGISDANIHTNLAIMRTATATENAGGGVVGRAFQGQRRVTMRRNLVKLQELYGISDPTNTSPRTAAAAAPAAVPAVVPAAVAVPAAPPAPAPAPAAFTAPVPAPAPAPATPVPAVVPAPAPVPAAGTGAGAGGPLGAATVNAAVNAAGTGAGAGVAGTGGPLGAATVNATVNAAGAGAAAGGPLGAAAVNATVNAGAGTGAAPAPVPAAVPGATPAPVPPQVVELTIQLPPNTISVRGVAPPNNNNPLQVEMTLQNLIDA